MAIFAAFVAIMGSACVVGTGYSHRGAPGGVVYAGFDAADDHKVIGAHVGLGFHEEQEGRPFSIRLDVNLGVPSRDLLTMEAGDVGWAALVFAGIDKSTGERYGDVTFPVGLGFAVFTLVGETSAVTVIPRYNYHLGDEAEPHRRHELLLTLRFGWIPEIKFAGM